MAENPPISTSVPETVTTDLNVEPQVLSKLTADFEDFWAEEDKKAGVEAPPAPGPAQETKEAAPEPEKPKVKLPEPAPDTPVQPLKPKLEPAAKDYTDEEIDKMSLIPGQQPEVYQGFKHVKDLWKETRTKLRTEEERIKQLETELANARQNAWTPETKADYEHAAGVRRRFDFVSDPDFIQQFHQPIQAQYEQIINDTVGMLPDRNQAVQWAQYMLQNFRPDQLNREYWLNSVVNQVPNELDRSTLLNQVGQLVKLQRDRDNEISKRTSDKSSFDNWIQEKTQHTAQRVQEEIMSEIGVQEKRIQEVLPRDPNAAKTTEERQAIEAHNERFNNLNNFFQETMKDISAHGPRAWVRASVEATRAKLMDLRVAELENELTATKNERDSYKTELDKIHGARRKISQTSGTPPASADKKNGAPSLKDLSDPRKAFDSYWGEIDRNQ